MAQSTTVLRDSREPTNDLTVSVGLIAERLIQSMRDTSGGLDGSQRALLERALAVAAEAMVFGDWYTGYHLVNVLLHSLVILALFSLIRYLMLSTGCTPRLAGYAALLSSLIFAVHPINTEVVNSIFTVWPS